jgi:hypothetical protein
MKERIVLLTTLAAVLLAAMALSGVAQAAPISGKADVQCLKLAIKTLGPSFNPSKYTFIGGTEDADNLEPLGTEDPNVFCGFGGSDVFSGTLNAGDIFLGGAGIDGVNNNLGTFFGGAGDDHVNNNFASGAFDGGDGTDTVIFDFGGCTRNVELGNLGLPC